MSERQIPHLRDIFGVPFDGMQYSPRSKRRGDFSTSDFSTAPCNRYTEQPKNTTRVTSAEAVTDPDSAVSVGSSGEEENYNQAHKKKGKGRSSRRDSNDNHPDQHGYGYSGYSGSGSRTLTQRDVKHLERHLSMKKTIRKKIMRDLRQAFVEDPSEFRADPARQNPDQLRQINLENLTFNDGPGDSNFLEILRCDEGHGGAAGKGSGSKGSKGSKGGRAHDAEDDRDSGHGSPTREIQHRYSSRSTPIPAHPQNVDDLVDEDANKKSGGGFWKRFTLKGRSSKR